MKTETYIFIETFPNQFNGDSSFPDTIDPGKVYYCRDYSTSVHLCPCGCGEKVYLPFKEKNEPGAYWGFDGKSFVPSILKRFGCKSHYFITNGKVRWA